MKPTPRRPFPGGRTVVAATVAAVCATAALPGAAAAATAGAAGVDPYIARNDHPMGSQISRVEGGGAEEQQGGYSTDSGVPGIDVSGWQGKVDWQRWWDKGKRFAYVKATEGLTYKNPHFTQQYNGSYEVGMIRGAYHFARPDKSTGEAQARYFASSGGGWSGDGRTLPGAVDLEYNPYGEACYGKTKTGMARWIESFQDTYHARTGRHPVIYTSTSWWAKCVSDEADYSETSPLWIARYSDSVGALPSGWDYHTIWQYSSDPIDQNSFNGTMAQLRALATG